jgi:type VI protein secretion system component Hcp
MRILASIKPVANLPKPPYDGFFECVSFHWEGSIDGLAANANTSSKDVTLAHQFDANSFDLLQACLAATRFDVNVLYERTGSSGPFIYLKVGLAQAVISRFAHRGVAGGSALPLEDLTFTPSAINGTFYDEGGRELGRTSFAA